MQRPGDLLLRAPVIELNGSIIMVPDQVPDPDGPMIVELDPSVLPEDQWILESATFQAMSLRAPADDRWLFPVSGLWIVPQNTPPETTADHATFAQLNLQSRGGFAIPLGPSPATGFRPFAGGGFAGAIGMAGVTGFQTTVPAAWTVRAIVVLAPGAAANQGPGAESYGKLTVSARVLRNLEIYQGD